MGKVIHRIHPHVMGNNDHRDGQDHNHNNFNGNDFFKRFGNHFDQNNNGKNGNGMHSFSATYSNVNGHVKRHFSKNGHSVNSKDAMDAMKKMNEDMDRSFKRMDRAFGGLGDSFGGDFLSNGRRDDHKHHPLRRLFGGHHHHNNDDGNLTGRIKNHK